MDIVRLEDEWGGGGFDVVVGHSFGGKVAYSYSQMRFFFFFFFFFFFCFFI